MKKHRLKKRFNQNNRSYKGMLITVVLLQLSSLAISMEYNLNFGEFKIEQNMTFDLSTHKDKDS